MQNLSQREREAKVNEIENILMCLNDSPFITSGVYSSRRQMAEAILNRLEQVEVEWDEYYHEARLANAN